MATNITGVSITRPLTDPNIDPSGDFIIGGQITPSGGGAWAESGDMYAEWDQGTGSWTTIGSSGALNVAAQTNPVTGLQDANEHTWTVYNDGTEGTFQVRIKLIEDDLTEYTTAATTVAVLSGPSDTPITPTVGGVVTDGTVSPQGIAVKVPAMRRLS